jgi:diadenosine tetraphosphate (Ap4A) HIT family hydrolase
MPLEDLRWHDRPLVTVPGVGAVIPGLGAFVPGYVLIFPPQHVRSTLEIPSKSAAAFARLVNKVVAVIRATFGPTTVFEHGTCAQEGVRRSACLDHAHLQVLPGSYGLIHDLVVAKATGCTPSPPGRSFNSSSYLFLDEPDKDPIYLVDPGLSQFFRRRIAAKLRVGDEWDYLLFPRLENVRETMNRLRGKFD